MPPLLERLGVELPVVQAGMGGGLSRHELAAAVSEAGGLGTIAVNGAEAIRRELAAAQGLTGRPLAVNLLLPFARRDWFEAAAAADVVVTFWGKPRRRTPGVWLHQCGSVAEARRARAAGADGVVLQGVEAGGHVRGTIPALRLLEQARAALPADYPLLLAGGIVAPADVRTALEAGAAAAVAGTRFLLSEESRAHPAYKQRLVEAEETILTELFGAGWPAPHRVVPNAATERWLGGVRPLFAIRRIKDERRELFRPPRANRLLNRLLAPGSRYLPPSLQLRMIRAQRPGSRLLTPAGPTDDGAGDADRGRRALRGGDRGAHRGDPSRGGARPRSRPLTGSAVPVGIRPGPRAWDNGRMGGGQILRIAESSIGRCRCELKLDGELDLWSVERLQAVLQRVARDNDAVLVGLEDCEFVDSTGIALFLQARRQLEDEGGRLALYGCSDQVLRIFTVAGLADAGIVFTDRGEALAELAVVE